MIDKIKNHAKYIYKESEKKVTFEDDVFEKLEFEDIMLYKAFLEGASFELCTFKFGNFKNAHLNFAYIVANCK